MNKMKPSITLGQVVLDRSIVQSISFQNHQRAKEDSNFSIGNNIQLMIYSNHQAPPLFCMALLYCVMWVGMSNWAYLNHWWDRRVKPGKCRSESTSNKADATSKRLSHLHGIVLQFAKRSWWWIKRITELDGLSASLTSTPHPILVDSPNDVRSDTKYLRCDNEQTSGQRIWLLVYTQTNDEHLMLFFSSRTNCVRTLPKVNWLNRCETSTQTEPHHRNHSALHVAALSAI